MLLITQSLRESEPRGRTALRRLAYTSRMRKRLPVFMAAIATIALSIGVTAQSPWFGVPLPAGLSDPHRPILDVSALKPAPAIVPAGEEAHRDLTGALIRKDLEAIVAYSKADRAHQKAWGRITGFRAADETHAWVLRQFNAAGLRDAETQTYTATQATWYPKNWSVKLVANAATGRGRARCDPRVGVSDQRLATRRKDRFDAPLVFVGATTDAALPDVDVKGTIAVQTLHPQAGAFSERTRTTERARELAKRGAVAVLNVVEQAGNMHVRDFSNCGVPCFNLGTDDGRFLTTVLERAKANGAIKDLRAEITLDTAMLDGLKGHNTIGTVRGRNDDDEIVIVNAHADGWFDAAGDNGDGLAVLIALARHFSKPANQPERRCSSWRAAAITAAA